MKAVTEVLAPAEKVVLDLKCHTNPIIITPSSDTHPKKYRPLAIALRHLQLTLCKECPLKLIRIKIAIQVLQHLSRIF